MHSANHILKLKEGDANTFWHFFDLFYDLICLYCYNFVKKENAVTATVNAFSALWTMKETLQVKNGESETTCIKSFLFDAAKNECIALMRRDGELESVEQEIRKLLQNEARFRQHAEIAGRLLKSNDSKKKK